VYETLLHRTTGFPYISHISSGLRWRGERYILKNVFFLREEVLIYDAPGLPRKDSRFDQELPSIRGRKWTLDPSAPHELYFTEPPDFHIFLIYPPAFAGGESATFPRMFSSSARRF
jgi:hypothetical protein